MILTIEKSSERVSRPIDHARQKFLEEVLEGLDSRPKQLHSKYFYDAAGDALFQQIMTCKEYYLTRCETEIFRMNAPDIAETLNNGHDDFDLIELGAGDASKTIYILKELTKRKANFTYVPIDISTSIIQHLQSHFPLVLPGLKVKGLNGEYMEMLKNVSAQASKKKVILFLGSNIGNMEPAAALNLCKEIKTTLNPGDQILIGFDLKKDPGTILAAYNDAAGYTREFNLNLLKRINRELNANFIISQFAHYPTYDPLTGACKSYLVSKTDQQVRINGKVFSFKQDEVIFMEVSQKYDTSEIGEMAESSGFVPIRNFFDFRHWFVDAIWRC
jgi:dimethylhistidine N-methyltransferase